MSEQFIRTELLLGKSSIEKLQNSKIAIFGLGGVGGHTLEALARSGIQEFDLIDNDIICLSNLNRQLLALHSTLGEYKVDVAEKRILDINPNIKVSKFKTFYTPETKEKFDFSKYDYVVDAIDTVVGKLSLVEECFKVNTPIISSMGAGNKINPTGFIVDDIYKTSVCPLAKVMRQELRKRKIKKLKVVYSKELPIKILNENFNENTSKKRTPGSNSFVPSVVGLIIASEVIKDLINYNQK